MKKSMLSIFAFTIMIAFLNSCTSQSEEIENAEQDVVEANEKLDEANRMYLNDVEQYRIDTEAKVIANKKAIAELKAEKADAKKEINDEKNAEIARLEQKNDAMESRMRNYKTDDETNWTRFKTEFSRDMEELGQAFKDFSTKNVK